MLINWYIEPARLKDGEIGSKMKKSRLCGPFPGHSWHSLSHYVAAGAN